MRRPRTNNERGQFRSCRSRNLPVNCSAENLIECEDVFFDHFHALVVLFSGGHLAEASGICAHYG